jgi:hypothetical protein
MQYTRYRALDAQHSIYTVCTPTLRRILLTMKVLSRSIRACSAPHLTKSYLNQQQNHSTPTLRRML